MKDIFIKFALAKNNILELCNSIYINLLLYLNGIANSETSKSHDSVCCFSRNRDGYTFSCFNLKND